MKYTWLLKVEYLLNGCTDLYEIWNLRSCDMYYVLTTKLISSFQWQFLTRRKKNHAILINTERVRSLRVQTFWWHLSNRDSHPGEFQPHVRTCILKKHQYTIQPSRQLPNTFRIHSRYFPGMFQTYSTLLPDMFQICSEHLPDIVQIPPSFKVVVS